MAWISKYVVPFFTVILYLPVFSQNYFYTNYQTFDEKNGYQCFGYTNYITQDNVGFIWIAGDNGLYRFDGTHFKNYRHILNDSNSLPFNFVTFNYQDKKGNFWVQVPNFGLYNFYPDDGSFKKFTYLNEAEFNVHQYQMKLPFEDRAGNLWFVLSGFGLAKWDAIHKKMHPYKICPNQSCGSYYSASWVNTAIEDTTDDTFWIGSNDGLIHFFPSSGGYVLYKNVPEYDANTGGNLGNVYTHLFFDAHHQLWMGTWGKGLQKFNPKTDKFEEYYWKPGLTGTRNICTGIGNYNTETLWVASVDKGLMLFNISTKQFTEVRKPGNEKESQFYTYMMESRQKTLFGFNSKKFVRISLTENYFSCFLDNRQQKNIDEWAINSFCKKDNMLYFGVSYNGHFCKYDFSAGSAKAITLTAKKDDESVNSLKDDANGIIWIGSNTGTYLFDPLTQKITQPLTKGSEDNLFGAQCSDILHDRDGTHWLATSKGLVHYDQNNRTLQKFTETSESNHRLLTNKIITLYQDKAGNIWFGSNWAGLGCYRKNIDKVVYFNKLLNLQNFSNNCNSITETSEGKILFVIQNLGLGELSQAFTTNQKFELLTSADGLPADKIFSVYKDSKQHIWLYTVNGLCNFNVDSKKAITFTEKDGLIKNFVSNRPYQDANGNMYIGFDSSFQAFDPNALLQRKDTASQIYISALFVNGKEWHMKTDSYLKLNYTQDNLSFDFAALSPTLNGDFEYAYKLVGLDKDWNFTGQRATGQYSSLRPGHYTLHIKAANRDKEWFDNEFKMAVIILPPWYQTEWFYTLLIFVIAGLLYALYRYRIRQILKLENIRTRIAKDLHDDIGSTLTSIAYHSELVKMNLKEENAMTTSLLEKIGSNARSMVLAMNDTVWAINPGNDDTSGLIDKMKNYAVEMLCERNIYYHFHAAGEIQKLKLNMTQRKNLYLLFKEALHNAIKHAACNEIIIRFEHENRILLLRVSDDGKGFEPGSLNGNGNGLANMKARAAEIKARIEIESTIKGGTKITVCCPIP